MKAHLLKVPQLSDESFTFKQFKQPNIHSQWHYHPEIELIRIHKGSGTQFLGDSIKRFNAGDIVLVGSNLPHFWRYDEDDLHHTTVYSTVIHFTNNLWGDNFLKLPENDLLVQLFEKSKRGLAFSGKTQSKIATFIEKINTSEGTYRLLYLLECLVIMANGSSDEVQQVASLGFENHFSTYEEERLNSIYNYSFKHFKDKIPLETIASEVALSPSSFCRYFKSKTGKSFTDFILEMRVSHACKLLHENKLNVKQICYDSGFNNFSSFHKHFKIITGLSPQNYQKAYFIKLQNQPNNIE
jgi:AraC-like DNA-binding protein